MRTVLVATALIIHINQKMDINVLPINAQINKNCLRTVHAKTVIRLLSPTLPVNFVLHNLAQMVKLIKNLTEVVESAQIIMSYLMTRDNV